MLAADNMPLSKLGRDRRSIQYTRRRLMRCLFPSRIGGLVISKAFGGQCDEGAQILGDRLLTVSSGIRLLQADIAGK